MSDTPKKSGAAKNVVAFTAAERELNAQRKRRTVPLDPPPMMPRGTDNVPAGHWRPDLLTCMPADEGCECPVEPIGFEGDLFYFIDSRGQFRALKAEKINQVGIQDLFAATPNYPKWMCPRYSKPVMSKDGKHVIKESEIVSFEADDIKEALFLACSRKGFFSPNDKMRGRGSWTFRRNQLVYHCGDELWVCEKGRFEALPTGVYDGKLYPHLSALPAPWTKPIAVAENPGAQLLAGFRRSKWARPNVDPILLLGWIGAAYLGGALNWRPSVLLLGDKGTGKSTLQDTLKALFGDALFHSSDSTAAGIYQAMGHDSRAVALDEMEPGLDERKASNIADLMRTSASGAIGRRGSAGGTASEFQMRSAFLFSAINNPLHTAADLSRVAVLRMLPFDKDSEKGEPINAETTGPMILAAMMRAWGDGGHGFKMQYDRFAAALAEGGHEKRGQDTYGTLLACAAMLLGDELAAELGVPLGPEEERVWAQPDYLAAESLPEVEDSKPNYRQCVDRILTSVVRAWRNSSHNTIGQVIHETRTMDEAGVSIEPQIDRNTAKRDINIAGFGLFNTHEIVAGVMRNQGLTLEAALTKYGLPRAGWVLAVPHQSSKVAELLEGTDWQRGGWRDAFQQCTTPGVMIRTDPINKVTIDGVQVRCTLIVLDRYHAAPER
jgi:hypothetical protein